MTRKSGVVKGFLNGPQLVDIGRRPEAPGSETEAYCSQQNRQHELHTPIGFPCFLPLGSPGGAVDVHPGRCCVYPV